MVYAATYLRLITLLLHFFWIEPQLSDAIQTPLPNSPMIGGSVQSFSQQSGPAGGPSGGLPAATIAAMIFGSILLIMACSTLVFAALQWCSAEKRRTQTEPWPKGERRHRRIAKGTSMNTKTT